LKKRAKLEPHRRLRAYRGELDPNNKQVTLCQRHADACRHVFNWGLELQALLWKEDKENIDAMGLSKILTQLKKHPEGEGGKPWLKGINAWALQSSLRDLDRAFEGFFRRCLDPTIKKKGYPKFKSKKSSKLSFRLYGDDVHLTGNGYALRLPTIGWVRLKKGQEDYFKNILREGTRVLFATVSEHAGRWFISVQVEEDKPFQAPLNGCVLGVDVGVTNLATTSDGEYFENPRAYKKAEKRLRLLQKSVSRKDKGSKNRTKAIRRLQKQHLRVSNIRKDILHQVSSAITKPGPSVIGMESLSNLSKGRRAKSNLDLAFVGLLGLIESKALTRGSLVVKAGRFFPSTKRCAHCFHKKSEDPGLTYMCEECGWVCERDYNASLNLELVAAGLAVLPSNMEGKKACGERSSAFWVRIQSATSLEEAGTQHPRRVG